jgi:hypothetical protein
VGASAAARLRGTAVKLAASRLRHGARQKAASRATSDGIFRSPLTFYYRGSPALASTVLIRDQLTRATRASLLAPWREGEAMCAAKVVSSGHDGEGS